MKILNRDNYPLAIGSLENIQDPKRTESGSYAYLLSNYTGLYGVALGEERGALLLCVTDNYELAGELVDLLARRR